MTIAFVQEVRSPTFASMINDFRPLLLAFYYNYSTHVMEFQLFVAAVAFTVGVIVVDDAVVRLPV